MARSSPPIYSFNAGEFNPKLYGRTDIAKYANGARTVQNFISLVEGGAERRPGSYFIEEVKDSDAKTRLIPFEFSTEQAYIIEVGNEYFRFYKDYGQIQVSGAAYEIVTPYLTAEIFDIKFIQDSDVMYLVHPSYQPRKLSRTGDTSWTLETVEFIDGPYLDENEGTTTLTPSGTTGDITITASAALFDPLHNGSIWRILHSTTWGYFQITYVTDSTHVNATVISTLGGTGAVTEWREGAFSGYQGYPSCLAFHEQRLLLAGVPLSPQTIYASWVGAYEDFTPPDTEDDGAYTHTLVAEKVNSIRWMSPSTNLIIGTSGGVWRVGSQDTSSPITQSNVKAVPVPRVGASSLSPINLGNIIVFAQRRGNPANYGDQIQELSYKFEIDSYVKSNLTVLSKHITKGGIVDWDLQTDPVPIIWSVRSDGMLLGMTYEREQEVIGWHSHPMDGEVESVCILPGDNQDDVYLIVKRALVEGDVLVDKRYIEVLEDMDWGDDQEDCFFVDCGLTYDSTPATTISGLDHLEGKTVAILADGAVHPTKVVTSGEITLDYAASVVQVGLPYTYILETLDLEGGSQEGTAQGKKRRVSKVLIRFFKSLGGYLGNEDEQDELDFRTIDDDLDAPPALFSGIKDFTFRSNWSREARIKITGSDPVPMAIMTMTPTLRTEDA